MDAEPLPSDRVVIFHSTMADQAFADAKFFGKQRRHIIGISLGLFDPNKAVLAVAGRFETEQFFDLKILGAGFKTDGSKRFAVQSRGIDRVHASGIAGSLTEAVEGNKRTESIDLYYQPNSPTQPALNRN